MKATDLTAGRGPSFALVVVGSDLHGVTLYSDPREHIVITDAKLMNEEAIAKGRNRRYRVERRVPISLSLLFDGSSSWGFGTADSLAEVRRNNGC